MIEAGRSRKQRRLDTLRRIGSVRLRGVFVLIATLAVAMVAFSGSVVGTTRPSQATDANHARGSGSAVDEWSAIADPADGPEAALVAAYEALKGGRAMRAAELSEHLSRERSDFSLAQLLQADLLAARAGRPGAFGSGIERESEDASRLQELKEEALRRRRARLDRPASDFVPAGFVRLPPQIRHAIAIDTDRSRLYLLRNGPGGLEMIKDFFVSVGANGVGKEIEGDKKTPLGVYWINEGVSAPILDQRLGMIALRINYPNALDRAVGRTGFGLYLHGVPPDVYAHPLRATEGCVSLSNEDAIEIFRRIEVGNTPVLISRDLAWVRRNEVHNGNKGFAGAFDAWWNARRSGDASRQKEWLDSGVTAMPARPDTQSTPNDLSVIQWNSDRGPITVVTEHGGEGARTLVRHYWTMQQGRWRIFFSGSVTVSEAVAARSLMRPIGSGESSGKPDRSWMNHVVSLRGLQDPL